MPTPEAIFKTQVQHFLKKTGKFWLRLNSGKVRVKGGYLYLCEMGTADFLICCPDPRWLEIKGPGQSTQKDRAAKQAEFAERVKTLGHRHLQATTLEQVVEFLK